MWGLDKLHHATLAQISVVATIFLICVAVVVWRMDLFGNGGGGGGPRNDELEVRFAVAKSYNKNCLGYIKALEETTQAILDLKSSCWKLEEKKEIGDSHDLLRERTRATVLMFQGASKKK